jgi:hypothetical protein
MPSHPPEHRRRAAGWPYLVRGGGTLRTSPPGAAERGFGAGGIAAAGQGSPEDYRVRPALEHYAASLADRALADRLLRHPRSERRELALSEAGYHRLSLARLLVLQAEATLHEGSATPADLVEPAEMAAAVAGVLAAAGDAEAARTAALAHWLVGKAMLLRGDRELAGEAFRAAGACVPGAAPSPEEGLATVGMAQLAWDEGRWLDATALFAHAALVFSQLEDPEAAAACHAQLGFLFLATGDTQLARANLLSAAAAFDGATAPALAARLQLGLARCDASLGYAEQERQHLAEARRYDLLPAPAGERIQRSWLRAQVARAAGRSAESYALLDAVRRQLLAGGSVYEAACATVELMAILTESGHAGPANALAAELALAFGLGSSPWLRQISRLLRTAATQPQNRGLALAGLKRRLRRGTPAGHRPPALTSLRSLADRLLRHLGESEDPMGAAGSL